MRLLFLALFALPLFVSPLPAQSSAQPKEVAKGSELRKDLFEILRPPIARVARQKVKFEGSLRRLGDWAFFVGRAVDENGEDVRIGAAESSDTAALWHREGDRWTLVESSAGHTDVIYLDWPEKHGAPKALISE